MTSVAGLGLPLLLLLGLALATPTVVSVVSWLWTRQAAFSAVQLTWYGTSKVRACAPRELYVCSGVTEVAELTENNVSERCCAAGRGQTAPGAQRIFLIDSSALHCHGYNPMPVRSILELVAYVCVPVVQVPRGTVPSLSRARCCGGAFGGSQGSASAGAIPGPRAPPRDPAFGCDVARRANARGTHENAVAEHAGRQER